MASRRQSVLMLLMIAAAIGACGLFDEDGENARLVLGQSVDRVPLGTDTTRVRSILGPPSQILRSTSGVTYRYVHGKHAGLEFHFRYAPAGVLERKTVFSISSPYAGKTREGIGIGSGREAVLDVLGQSQHSGVGSDGALLDRYVDPDHEIGFLYEEGRVFIITMSGPLR